MSPWFCGLCSEGHNIYLSIWMMIVLQKPFFAFLYGLYFLYGHFNLVWLDLIGFLCACGAAHLRIFPNTVGHLASVSRSCNPRMEGWSGWWIDCSKVAFQPVLLFLTCVYTHIHTYILSFVYIVHIYIFITEYFRISYLPILHTRSPLIYLLVSTSVILLCPGAIYS